MNTYQRGATMWSTLSIVIMLGFLAIIAFNVGGLFIDHKFIKSSMQEVVNRPDFKTAGKKQIMTSIGKRLMIDNIRGLEKDAIVIRQDKTGEKYLHIKYSPKARIMANVYAMIEFEEEIREVK